MFIARFIPLLIAVCLVAGLPAFAKEVGRAEIHVKVSDNQGDRQFCAGETVYAIPVNSKSTKIVKQFYPSTESSFASIYATAELIVRREGTITIGGSSPDATRIFRKKLKGTKRGKCNENDIAIFEKLKPQEYYLIIPVFWKRKDLPAISKDIRLRGGGRTHITAKIPTNYRGGTYLVKTAIAPNETTEFILENKMVDTAPD